MKVSEQPNNETIKPYFSGNKLYGDDFTINEIKDWFEYEKEAYADLGSKNKEQYIYGYHAFNILNGFNHLPSDLKFKNAMGFGAAYGYEIEPVKDRIEHLTIIDPSDAFEQTDVYGVPVTYVRPTLEGDISYPDGAFDLILCFGTLHHIPNVSKIIAEFGRCLSPNGFILIREPIISMGDWRNKRPGLTAKERGIPLHLFRNMIKNANVRITKETLCFFPVTYKIGSFFKYRMYSSPLAVLFDKWASWLFSWNVRYHRTKKFHTLAPTNAFYVLTK
jgi:SAM-dependent methyltransferase